MVVVGSCVAVGMGAFTAPTSATDGTAVGLEWSGPPGLNDGLPVHSVSCVSPTFCVAVGDWGGSGAGAGSDALIFDGNSWSDPPSTITSTGLTSVSCTSDTFCMATGYGNKYVTFNGSTWSAGADIVPPPTLPPNGSLDVSCGSPLLCVAVNDVAGTVYTYNGSSWSLVPSVTDGTNGLTSVSCAGPSMCAVAGGGYLATFDGTTWTVPGISAVSVACGSPTLCAAVDIGNDIQVFDGTAWKDDGVIDGANPIVTLSCAGSSYCAAVDQSGDVVDYDGTNWTVGPLVEERNYPTAPALEHVSCVSPTFCVAIDENENVFYNNGGSWTNENSTTFDGNDPQFSCASTALCVGVGTDGKAVTMLGTTWTGPSNVGYTAWGEVSCAPATTFCMEEDGGDNGLVYDGQTWTTTPTLPGADIFAVSCPAVGSCIGMGNKTTYIYSGGSWSVSPATIADAPDGALSCASIDFCATADENSNLFIFDGSSWSEQSGVLPSQGTTNYARSVSCPVVGFCMAVDTYGGAVTYQNGNWTAAPIGAVEHGFAQNLSSVSCASPSFCVAVNEVGTTAVYENSEWTQIAPMGSDVSGNDGGSSVSCPTTTFCVGMDSAGIVQYLYPDGTTTSGGATVDSASVAQTVTYSATVSAPASDVVGGPSGEVSFATGSVALCDATVSAGTASCSSGAAPEGADIVNAQYSGDIYHAASVASSQLLVGTDIGLPTVTIATPAQGAVYGEDTVVQAQYTCHAAKGTTVSSCTGTVASGAEIGTSAGDLGAQQFTVVAKDADGQSATAATSYTVVGAPQITSFSPPDGPVGSVVTIDGVNLVGAAVTIGRKPLQMVTDSATTITATLPATAKTGVLTVTAPGGKAKSSGKFKVTKVSRHHH